MRKYRGDARRVQTKGCFADWSISGEACRDVPTDHEARCRQKQLTSCKTEESLEDSALGGMYAREAEWEQEVLLRQSRKTIAGSHDPGDEHKTSYSWDDGAGQHVDERIACRVASHYKGGVSLALADQIHE